MSDRKKNIVFIAFVYVFSWSVTIIGRMTGALQNVTGGAPEGSAAASILMLLAAWCPTVTVIVLSGKLFPEISIKNFYKNAFRERLQAKLILAFTLVQLLVFCGVCAAISLFNDFKFSSLIDLSWQSLIMGFIVAVVSGATGEESGWRGFLQPSFEKKFGIITSSLIVGIIWAFFHAPLWFLVSGLAGKDLMQYIISHITGLTALSVIMGICYNRCKNLFVPIWIHLMYNLVAPPVFTGDILDYMTWYAIFSTIAATGYIIWHVRSADFQK